jgi:hypothetical protein
LTARPTGDGRFGLMSAIEMIKQKRRIVDAQMRNLNGAANAIAFGGEDVRGPFACLISPSVYFSVSFVPPW